MRLFADSHLLTLVDNDGRTRNGAVHSEHGPLYAVTNDHSVRFYRQ